MKYARLVYYAAMLAVVWALGGCSQAVFLRIFNRTDHAISILERTDGKVISVSPGGDAIVPLWGVTKGKQHGFVITDGGKELFYAVLTEEEDRSKGYASWSRSQPKESARSHRFGLEYLFEYAGSSEVFALRASGDTIGSRVDPQPAGFPIKPNQSLEPTR